MPNFKERVINELKETGEQFKDSWTELKKDAGTVEAISEIIRSGGLILLVPKGEIRFFRHAPYTQPSNRLEKILEVFSTGGLSLLERRPNTNQDKK